MDHITKGRITMSMEQAILREFEGQVPITRKFLEPLPENHLTWKPHQKSMSAGQLAFHLAFVPGGVIQFVQNSPAPAPDFASFPQPATKQEILDKFEESVDTVRDLLPKMDEAKIH